VSGLRLNGALYEYKCYRYTDPIGKRASQCNYSNSTRYSGVNKNLIDNCIGERERLWATVVAHGVTTWRCIAVIHCRVCSETDLPPQFAVLLCSHTKCNSLPVKSHFSLWYKLHQCQILMPVSSYKIRVNRCENLRTKRLQMRGAKIKLEIQINDKGNKKKEEIKLSL
jgi:hypothetical protein